MTRIFPTARVWALLLVAALVGAHAAPTTVSAAPFAAHVMDARTGQPVYAQNAETRLHPASLTKMMTLYLAFAAIERGQVRLDSQFPVSTRAANQPPSKLGLRAGQRIELRYLIRAAAIKSANDAATAIGEGLAGSEAAFAQQMTATARALGMRNTQFRNAHGLTQDGHYSTAHDMSILGRRLFYDFPQYYNIFSRRSADAGVAQVSSTNKRFLDDYAGADGIKTGYTRAAGFNLTASAQRGNKRIIATVFGGTSTAQRNQVMAQLLDAGFNRVPSRVREVRPEPAQLTATKVVRRAQVEPTPAATQAQPQRLVLSASEAPRRVTRESAGASTANALLATPIPAVPAASGGQRLALATSPRPRMRPGTATATAVASAVAEAAAAPQPAAAQSASLAAPVLASSSRPAPAPRNRASTASLAAPAPTETAQPASRTSGSLGLGASPAPRPRSETVILAAMGEGDLAAPEAVEVVRRDSGGSRNWSVSLGTYRSQAEADRKLLSVALQDGDLLGNAQRQVANTQQGFQANFLNLTRANAELTCNRLQVRQETCMANGR